MKGNIWAKVLGRLEGSVKRNDFDLWLKPTSLAADDGQTLEIRVPDADISNWVQRHYATAIAEALTACGRSGTEVTFVVGPPVAGDLAKPTRGKVTQGKSLAFETLEPHETSVVGAKLLDELAVAFERYVTLPEHASTALALWVFYTYTHEAAFFSPILAITSPMKGCGKTSLLKVLSSLVHRRQIASNVTSSVLFRLIDRVAPTLLIDEADTFLPDNEALRGILNSGHTRTTACLIRTVGDDYEPRVFTTWCPKAIALIGRLPTTLEDRSIQIQMRRQMPGEQRYRRERLREERIDGDHLPYRRMAARWAEDHLDALRARDPETPSSLSDRAGDNWRPLLAIADEVGGAWPERARAAAEALSGEAFQDEQEPGVELLRDLFELLYPEPGAGAGEPPVLSDDADGLIPTTELVKALAAIPDRPWGTWRGEKPVTPYALSRILKPMRIFPAGIRRVGDQAIRGYRRESFEEAFCRYLPPQLIGRCKPNVYGPKSQFSVDRNEGSPINQKSGKSPDFIGSATPDQLKSGKKGVVPIIPALRRSLARAELRPVGPSRVPTRAAKGKAN